MAEAGPSVPISIPNTTLSPSSPTLRNTIHSLLIGHSSKNLSLTHLHPFAPSSTRSDIVGIDKGKGKDVENEADTIKGLRDAVNKLKVVLNTPSGKDGGTDVEGRLIRGLKEISSHQLPLIQQLTSLTPNLSVTSSVSSFPSHLLNLHPIKLLEAVSTSLKLQCFIEDSQFGLLKSSLAIAGTRFVIDVDLETGPSSGVGGDEDEDEDGDVDVDMESKQPQARTTLDDITTTQEEVRNKVRLTKLIVNHVTSSGGTAKSNYISTILRTLIDDYLRCYDSTTLGMWEKQVILDRLIDGLKELKDLDDYSTRTTTSTSTSIDGEQVNGNARDGFEDIEKIVSDLNNLYTSDTRSRIYPTLNRSIFPTFHLLPQSIINTEPNPMIKLRPAKPHEDIPAPSLDVTDTPAQDQERHDDVNMDSVNSSEKTTQSNWIIEIVPENGMDGLVVRRNWLSQTILENDEADGVEGIKVENLLYRAYSPPPLASLSPQIQLFPYTSTFSHLSPSPGKHSDIEKQQQHWSMVNPGPTAFVVGRIGMSSDIKQVARVLNSLRNQIILNNMFNSVFIPQLLKLEENNLNIEGDDGYEEDGGDDINNLLSGDQTSIPINLNLLQDSITITFPLIKNEDNKIENIQIVVRPSEKEKDGYVDVRVDGNEFTVDDASEESKRDLIRIVRGVIRSKSKA
ncbi:uncharacterized protein L199_006579 [Kwoniella botswanensis]|uniref:uncharacterized protein n=1 Tax=Kwoniella botswanensis TaxID=1268659 RepID=UPI00315C5646